MASDCAAIAQLASTVERLAAELVTVKAKLVTALQTQRTSQIGRGGRGCGRGRGAGVPAQTGAVEATRAKEQDLEPLIH